MKDQPEPQQPQQEQQPPRQSSTGRRIITWIIILIIIALIIAVAFIFTKRHKARALCNSMVEVLLFEKQITTSFSQVPAGVAPKDANLSIDPAAVKNELPQYKADTEMCYRVVNASCNIQEISARQKYVDCFKDIFNRISPMKEALDATNQCKQYALHDVQSECYQATDRYIKEFQKKYNIKLQKKDNTTTTPKTQ